MNQFRFAVYGPIVLLMLSVTPLGAQNFTADARLVGMGGGQGNANDARRLAGDARNYRSIGIPIGLIQVFKNTNVFRPENDDFNPLHAMELLSSPLHYTVGRKESGPGEILVRDLVNGRLNRDLNTYRGFAPKSQLDSIGLASPSFGKTIWTSGAQNRPRHGVYVGIGPYLSIGTHLTVDERLINLLGASSNTYLPNTTFTINNTTDGQAAAAITGGYRAHLSLPGGGATSGRDGIYLVANYNYLRGMRYDTATTGVRFDTDSNGLVTLAPTTTPLTVGHTSSSSGSGFAIDLGTAFVVDNWDLNFSANGISNRINWKDRKAETFVLSSLLQGFAFVKTTLPAPAGEQEIRLPVRYLAGGAYNAERWTAASEVSHGLQDWEFRAGGEYRRAVCEFRSGVHYKNDTWQPSGGIGLNFTRRFGIDAAVYGTSTNVERERKAALALSLRIGGS